MMVASSECSSAVRLHPRDRRCVCGCWPRTRPQPQAVPSHGGQSAIGEKFLSCFHAERLMRATERYPHIRHNHVFGVSISRADARTSTSSHIFDVFIFGQDHGIFLFRVWHCFTHSRVPDDIRRAVSSSDRNARVTCTIKVNVERIFSVRSRQCPRECGKRYAHNLCIVTGLRQTETRADSQIKISILHGKVGSSLRKSARPACIKFVSSVRNIIRIARAQERMRISPPVSEIRLLRPRFLRPAPRAGLDVWTLSVSAQFPALFPASHCAKDPEELRRD